MEHRRPKYKHCQRCFGKLNHGGYESKWNGDRICEICRKDEAGYPELKYRLMLEMPVKEAV